MTAAVKGYVALDKFLFGDGGGAGVLNHIVSNDDFALVERALSLEAFQEEISRFMSRLVVREQEVLCLYFGLEGRQKLRTFADIGAEIGLLTPPLGISCFVIKTTLDDDRISLKDVFLGALPFAGVMLLVLILIINYPELSIAILR